MKLETINVGFHSLLLTTGSVISVFLILMVIICCGKKSKLPKRTFDINDSIDSANRERIIEEDTAKAKVVSETKAPAKRDAPESETKVQSEPAKKSLQKDLNLTQSNVRTPSTKTTKESPPQKQVKMPPSADNLYEPIKIAPVKKLPDYEQLKIPAITLSKAPPDSCKSKSVSVTKEFKTISDICLRPSTKKPLASVTPPKLVPAQAQNESYSKRLVDDSTIRNKKPTAAPQVQSAGVTIKSAKSPSPSPSPSPSLSPGQSPRGSVREVPVVKQAAAPSGSVFVG